jgi:hypothetical protein
MALLGLGLLAWVVSRVGLAHVLGAIHQAAGWLPLLIALELGWLSCTTLAVRKLYGRERRKISLRTWVRGSVWGYVTMLVAPMGRATGEAVRAVVLSSESNDVLAGLSAVRMQVISMYANAIACALAAGMCFWLAGTSAVSFVIAGNAAATAAIGTAVLLAQGSGRVSRWAQRVFKKVESSSWEGAFAAGPVWGRALAWETLGRGLQWIQYTLALLAVSGTRSFERGLVSQGIHLVAATVGDLIPAQLGVNEANFALAAPTLGMTPAAAASVGVIVHVAQLGTMMVCLVVALLVRTRRR